MSADDVAEIRELLQRYCDTIDGGDAEGWAGTFTEDGVFDRPGQTYRGRKALTEFAAGVRGRRHEVVDATVDVRGDSATALVLAIVHREGEGPGHGTYEDQLVRTAAGWRFAHRTFRPRGEG